MRKTLLVIGLAAALLGGLGVGIAHAEGIHAGSNITVAHGTTIDKTYFAAAQTIDIAGTVNGDLICAGQDITVSGVVNGDVICAGQSVHISGTVTGDVRVAGQNVTIGGAVAGNLSAAGQDITSEAGSKVTRDASVAGQNATLNGTVGRDLLAGSQNMEINGNIGRNVLAADQTMVLGSTAHVGGDITYTSAEVLNKAKGAAIAGRITRHTPPQRVHNEVRLGAVIGGGIVLALFILVSLLVTSLVLVLLVPHAFHEATDVALSHPWRTLLVGFLASIAAPVAVVTLMVTVIGIPLALLLSLIWMVVVFLSAPFAAYYLGRLLMGRTEPNAVLLMLLGASILLVIYFIPVIGAIVSAVAIWLGIGIIVQQARRLPKPVYTMTPAVRKR